MRQQNSFTLYASDRGLVSRIHKNLKGLNTKKKKPNAQLKNWVMN